MVTILLFVAALSLWSAIPAEAVGQALPQDPALLTGKLENGLTYYIQANKQPEKKAELRLFINAGSIVEDDDQRGLAHFTEHMAFNGTKNFSKSQMLDFLNSVGMGYMNGLNGMTSYDFTMYMFKIPTDKVETLRKGFLILSDMAYQVEFDPVELEKERGVIIEEWRMGQDAQSRVQQKTSAVTYAGSPYAEHTPIGTYEVLSKFKLETIKRFYNDWYRPDLQSVVVVGDFNPQDILALVNEYFGKIPARKDPRPLPVITVPEHQEPRSVVVTDKELQRSTLNLLWKYPPTTFKTVGDAYAQYNRDLFYDMINSRLTERTQQANPPFSYAAAYEFSQVKPVSVANVTALIGNGQAEDALTAIVREVARIRQHGFTQTELDRAKLNTLRRYESALAEKDTRQSANITWSFFAPITEGAVYMSPEQDYAIASALIPQISLEECNALINKLIAPRNQVITIEGVEKEGLVYPSAEKLLQIANLEKDTVMDAYIDVSSTEPLLANIPKPGKITKEKTFKASGIKRWVLSNGITVYSKKTDFKNDEIVFLASSPGGYSKLPVSDMNAAKYLYWYISESGVGEFDAAALDKALAGKILEVSPTVNLYSETLDGSCSPADLETMFQLIYQTAKAPRWNQTSLEANLFRIKGLLQDRQLNPEMAFFDSLQVLTKNNNPYNVNTRISDLDKISLDQMRGTFENRFSDFSDFTFTFVGNFDEAKLREYVQTYLATLPSTGRREKPSDVGMRPNSGLKTVTFKKGGDNKSYVGLITTGKAKLDPVSDIARNAMLMVVNEKLRENIREERSGVYFVQTMADVDAFPSRAFSLLTIMSCSADRVGELTDAIIATMDSIRAGQFDEKYIDYARITMQKRYEESIRRNNYWMQNIDNSVNNGANPENLLKYPEIYSSINRKMIVNSAKKYLLHKQNLIKLNMMPEN